MKPNKIIIWTVGILALVAIAVLVMKPASGGVTNVDTAEMADLAADGVRVVDVRTAGEFGAGHIPGAENVPVSTFNSVAQGWNPDEPIAIYCATGSRSVEAVNYLESLGFSEVYHYNAGIVTWTGEIDSGTAVAAATPDVPAETFDSPVMYEFYTDW